ERAESPSAWMEQAIAHQLEPQFVAPFLDRVAVADQSKYEHVLLALVGHPTYSELAVTRILRHPRPDEGTLVAALDQIKPPEGQHDRLWLSDSRIPTTTMARLLGHVDPRVRAAAAIGEWTRSRE